MTHPNIVEQTLTQEEKKMNVKVIKWIVSEKKKKDQITITQEPRLENSQGRNWKKKK